MGGVTPSSKRVSAQESTAQTVKARKEAQIERRQQTKQNIKYSREAERIKAIATKQAKEEKARIKQEINKIRDYVPYKIDVDKVLKDEEYSKKVVESANKYLNAKIKIKYYLNNPNYTVERNSDGTLKRIQAKEREAVIRSNKNTEEKKTYIPEIITFDEKGNIKRRIVKTDSTVYQDKEGKRRKIYTKEDIKYKNNVISSGQVYARKRLGGKLSEGIEWGIELRKEYSKGTVTTYDLTGITGSKTRETTAINKEIQKLIDETGNEGKITVEEVKNNPDLIDQLKKRAVGYYKELNKEEKKTDLKTQILDKFNKSTEPTTPFADKEGSIKPKPIFGVGPLTPREQSYKQAELKLGELTEQKAQIRKEQSIITEELLKKYNPAQAANILLGTKKLPEAEFNILEPKLKSLAQKSSAFFEQSKFVSSALVERNVLLDAKFKGIISQQELLKTDLSFGARSRLKENVKKSIIEYQTLTGQEREEKKTFLENVKAIPEKYEKFKEDIQTQEGKQEFKESALSLVLNPIRGFARIEQKAKPTLNVPFIDDSKLKTTPKKGSVFAPVPGKQTEEIVGVTAVTAFAVGGGYLPKTAKFIFRAVVVTSAAGFVYNPTPERAGQVAALAAIALGPVVFRNVKKFAPHIGIERVGIRVKAGTLEGAVQVKTQDLLKVSFKSKGGKVKLDVFSEGTPAQSVNQLITQPSGVIAPLSPKIISSTQIKSLIIPKPEAQLIEQFEAQAIKKLGEIGGIEKVEEIKVEAELGDKSIIQSYAESFPKADLTTELIIKQDPITKNINPITGDQVDLVKQPKPKTKTSISTLGIEIEGFSYPIISKTPQGIKFGVPSIKDPIPLTDLKGAVAIPRTSAARKVLSNVLDLTPAESQRLSNLQTITRGFRREQGLEVRDPFLAVKTLKDPLKSSKAIQTAIGKEGGFIFGSLVGKQLPVPYQIVSGDIDVSFPTKTEKGVAKSVKKILKAMNLVGEDASIDPENPLHIINKEGEKILEGKAGIGATKLSGDVIGKGAFGFDFPTPGLFTTRTVGGKAKFEFIGTQLLKKAASISFFRPEPTQTQLNAAENLPQEFSGAGILPKANRFKDLPVFLITARGLAASPLSTIPSPLDLLTGLRFRGQAKSAIGEFVESFTPAQREVLEEKVSEILKEGAEFKQDFIIPPPKPEIKVSPLIGDVPKFEVVPIKKEDSPGQVKKLDLLSPGIQQSPVFAVSPTIAASPTITASPYIDVSPMLSPTPSLSPSFTVSPRQSLSPSISPLLELSPTPSPSPSPAPSPYISPRQSPTPSPSPSPYISPYPWVPETVISPYPSSRDRSTGGYFSVEVRRRGVFKRAPTRFRNIKSAFESGIKKSRTTAAASFRIVGPKKNIKSYSGLLPRGFRKSTRESGVIIQKRGFRIGTPGEKKEITEKGLFALRTKNIFGGK